MSSNEHQSKILLTLTIYIFVIQYNHIAMYYIINLMYTNSFKVDCELILITLTHSFLVESIHLIFERREKPDISFYAERKARKHLVAFL